MFCRVLKDSNCTIAEAQNLPTDSCITVKATITRVDNEANAVKIADMHSACELQVNDKIIGILQLHKTYIFRNVLIKRYYVLDHQMYLRMTRSSNIMMTADTLSTVFLDTETRLYRLYQLHPERQSVWNAIVDKNTILSSIYQNNSTMVCICVCVFGHFNSFFILTLQLSISHFIISTLVSY